MVEQAGVLALPETELRAKVWTADATATLPALRERVGLDAVLLRCVSEHEDPSARVQQATLVAAPRDTAPPPPGARWVGRDDLAGAAFQHDEHAAVAAGILDELAGGPAGAGRAPWAAPGWFHAAERWLRGSLDTLGYEVTGPVQQLRAWELSCILRTPTAQGDVYFKAVRESPLFVNEALVTRPLAALFPDRHCCVGSADGRKKARPRLGIRSPRPTPGMRPPVAGWWARQPPARSVRGEGSARSRVRR
jgi:hypothetical protein